MQNPNLWITPRTLVMRGPLITLNVLKGPLITKAVRAQLPSGPPSIVMATKIMQAPNPE